MRQQSTWGRRSFTALLASGVAMSAATFAGVSAAEAAPVAPPTAEPAAESVEAKDATTDTLETRDVELLAKAEAEGVRAVTLIIATDKGEAADVATAIKKLGGTITRRFDKVGYLLASVPTAKVLKTAELAGIAAVDLDEKVRVPDPKPETMPGAKVTTQAAPVGPGATTPAANAFMPANEIGAVDFKKAHPTWDGRGVTIGIMDSGVDLDNPALQTTSTGERKIVDWVTATDPVLENDASWRPMTTSVNGPSFTFGGATYKAPAGAWKVNTFAESITAASEPKGDVNLDGDTTDRFGVLYNPVTNDIRVDSNQNLDFTDDAVMRPYREKFQVGHFGTDKPETEIRDQMPFVVEFREDVDTSPVGGPAAVDYVSIGLVEDMHASHVSGIASANDMLGNPNFDGVAPGAKLVSSRACSWGGGCTAAALTTGMVDLVVNRKVDVINMSIGGLPALNDGNNARARLYDTLINDYGVQMFISAGNSGPGINTIGDPSVATNVVSVAASISKETWLANYGSVTRKAQQLFNFSSRGPREDGGFKPNIAAPGSAVATAPMWQAGAPVPEAGYTLPPGYAMINGTSMASPSAAGGAALLLSAAKANDLGVTPATLRRAIYSSAKEIPATSVAGQGYGLIDVVGAWTLLAKKFETRKYTSLAQVCTPFSDQFTPKNVGVGTYNICPSNAGGQVAGVKKGYVLRLTRTSGPATAIRHNLSWKGNDGTWSTGAPTVDLPLNKTVAISTYATAPVGAHAALLRVDDPATPVVDFEVLNTVIVANEQAAPGFSFGTESTVDRNSTNSYFVNVPAGAAALQVNLSGVAAGSQTRFVAFSPAGVPVDSTSSLECYTNFSNQATCKGPERSYANPIPGIWEIEVESRRTSPALENPYELTTRIQGTQVTPAVVQLASVVKGQPTPVTWTVKNQFGPVVVTGQGGPLQSAVQSRPTIAQGEQKTYEVVVPAGATSLDVAISKPGDAAADLDLTVLLGDVVVGQSADGDSDEAVSVPKPAAGTYTVVVDGYAVPAGTTAFDYRDVYSSPALGTVQASTAQASLGAGGTATVTGQVTALDVPPAGRTLSGQMNVVTDQGAVVGTGLLQIGEVK